MPTFISTRNSNKSGEATEYATEEELLAFANKLRQLGGADTIDAFFPARPNKANACLIAKALNFGCSVTPTWPRKKNGEFQFWTMEFPYDFPDDRVRQIADELGLKLYQEAAIDDFDDEGDNYLAEEIEESLRKIECCKSHGDIRKMIILPRLIGNAAQAFDEANDGWTIKYRDDA